MGWVCGGDDRQPKQDLARSEAAAAGDGSPGSAVGRNEDLARRARAKTPNDAVAAAEAEADADAELS